MHLPSEIILSSSSTIKQQKPNELSHTKFSFKSGEKYTWRRVYATKANMRLLELCETSLVDTLIPEFDS